MGLEIRWVGLDEADRVARTRARCYAHAENQQENFLERTRNDPRGLNGDFLLVESAGQPVGTATGFPLKMWVRGRRLNCQGVAWVGTTKTARRRAGSAGAGVASTVMTNMLQKARERGDVVSALIPFRGSFYEHFGYGFVERRTEWTLPLSTLPTGDCEGIRFSEPADSTTRAALLQRVVQHGQCDVERTEATWQWRARIEWPNTMQFVDQPSLDAPLRSSIVLQHQQVNGKDLLTAMDHVYEDIPGLIRQLVFLGSLKDQYSSVKLSLPSDLRLNWLLKESQLPHRPVNHAVASGSEVTRLQLRILDHRKFLDGMAVGADTKGSVVVAVHETEGTHSRFKLDIADGHCDFHPTEATATFECIASVWAAIATGDLPATEALRLGVATGVESAAQVLNVLSGGPAPFCHEYF